MESWPSLSINVERLPEVIFTIRRAMAERLRKEAEAESDPRIARRLVAIAADFEVDA